MMDERKHLVLAEVEKLMEIAKGSRHAARDRCLLLLMFRHGLRVSEACGLQLSHVDVESRVLHVARLKHGLSTTHPLRGDEIRAIKAWLAERARMKPKTDAFFISERRGRHWFRLLQINPGSAFKQLFGSRISLGGRSAPPTLLTPLQALDGS
jgi:type 1 fimbriae regulatory protein FimB